MSRLVTKVELLLSLGGVKRLLMVIYLGVKALSMNMECEIILALKDPHTTSDI